MHFINSPFFKKVYQKITGVPYNISYAQLGEDIIIDFIIGAKKILEFSYLDIGANHPVKFNNTFKFYERGFTGVCVEPDPDLHKILGKRRPKDICLNIGIAGRASGSADFFIMNKPELNTFSLDEAISLEKASMAKIIRIIRVPLSTIEEILDEHFEGKAPVFINLDVEGFDEEILASFPFHKYRPNIFCIETVHYTEDASSEKRTAIMQLLNDNGYKPFADTYVNTIFLDVQAFEKSHLRN